jgi:tetratricopeptide (TPR) repeat protein
VRRGPDVAPVTEDEAADADAGASSDAFDLAAELADELGETATDPSASSGAAGDDFQYSVEEVFSEFKKGLEKVVKPEDVETHYDLGIAYKEMGLLDDAIGEMRTARDGCIGKKKEVDCLLMAGVLQAMKGDHQSAVTTYKDGLTSEHAQSGEAFKALAFELAVSYEALNKAGKALFWAQKIVKIDAKYRDVSGMVTRLGTAKVEDDPLPAKNGSNGSAGKGGSGSPGTPSSGTPAPPKGNDPSKAARKVGYV